MILTDDMYDGLRKLEKWYHKYQYQFIEISGVIGTGTWQLIQKFFDDEDIDMKEVMYLSYDQKQVLELAAKKYHAYYINGIIYKYIHEVDFDTIPVINPHSSQIEGKWVKEVRKKIDSKYKIIVVFDSVLLDDNTVRDLSTFGLQVILIRDPMMIPVSNSYTFMRDPNIRLREVHPDLYRNPIVYFAYKILNDERIDFGNYDTVSVVHKKEMNLYNLRSADMIITLTDDLRNQVNNIFREKILKQRSIINVPGEKMIVMNNMYGYKLVNKDEKRIKVYLTKGTVGNIMKCNKHVVNTKYVPITFQPEFYFESFEDLVMDRHYLNHIEGTTRQVIPDEDEIIYLDYAYALTPALARLGHWGKITLINDSDMDIDHEFQQKMLYTAIAKARQSLTLIT